MGKEPEDAEIYSETVGLSTKIRLLYKAKLKSKNTEQELGDEYNLKKETQKKWDKILKEQIQQFCIDMNNTQNIEMVMETNDNFTKTVKKGKRSRFP